MGPKTATEAGTSHKHMCNASGVAEDDLANLARLVGGGSAEQSQESIALVEDAPSLEFDLEGELAKAFDVPQAIEPQPVRDAATIESAFSSVKIKDGEQLGKGADVDFSDMIGDELERALTEEVAADDILGQMPTAPVSTPPIPQETLTPWDEPTIAENPEYIVSIEDNINAAIQPSFEPVQMADYEAPMMDYTDPAAVFDEIEKSQSISPANSPDLSQMHVDSVLGGAAALGLAATNPQPIDPMEIHPEIPVTSEYTVAPLPQFDTADVVPQVLDQSFALNDEFQHDEVTIPDPQMIPPVGGGKTPGRRAAFAVAAIAFLAGGATLAWNSTSGNKGNAPTILASSEPVKVKPKNAGGKIVPNQDLAVYKKVDGAEKTTPSQKQLRDKTEKPIVVAAKTPQKRVSKPDQSTTGGLVLKPRRVRTVVVRPDGTIISTTNDQVSSGSGTGKFAESTLALKPKLVSTSKTTAKAIPKKISKKVIFTPPKENQTTTTAKAKPVIVAKLQPQTQKLKPVAVKKVPVKRVKKAVPKKAALKATPKVASPYAVQIASQRSAGAAQKSYKQLSRRYASVLKGKGVDIRKGVIKGKGTYFRVRIPAQSKAAAVKLCGRLKAKGGACFVTR